MWVQGPAAGRQAWLQGAAKLRRPAGSAPTLPTACSLPRPPPPARSWKRQLARLPANPRAVAVVQLLRIEEEGAFVGLVGGSPGKAGSTDTQVWWPPNTRLPMHGAVPWCTSSYAYGCPRHILSSYSPQPHGGRSGRQNCAATLQDDEEGSMLPGRNWREKLDDRCAARTAGTARRRAPPDAGCVPSL